ncbi:MAG: MarR family transcriptional regulator [Acidimicrobiales bacterium]
MHYDDESSTTPQVLAARPSLMRALNEQMLLEQIRRLESVSRSELTAVSGLSKPTVAVALTTLEKEGLIRVAGRISGRRGLATVLYQLRPEAGFVLGLDVGREYVRGAIADLSGAVGGRGQRKVHPTSSAGRVSELVTLADELVAMVKIKSGVTRGEVDIRTALSALEPKAQLFELDRDTYLVYGPSHPLSSSHLSGINSGQMMLTGGNSEDELFSYVDQERTSLNRKADERPDLMTSIEENRRYVAGIEIAARMGHAAAEANTVGAMTKHGLFDSGSDTYAL